MNGEEERQYSEVMRDSEWKYFACKDLGGTSCLVCLAVQQSAAVVDSRASQSQRGSSLRWLSSVLSGAGTALLHCHSADHHVEVPFS
jgi:hypothetical protein